MSAMKTRPRSSKVTGLAARERAERVAVAERRAPRACASQVSARYIAPVSR